MFNKKGLSYNINILLSFSEAKIILIFDKNKTKCDSFTLSCRWLPVCFFRGAGCEC